MIIMMLPGFLLLVGGLAAIPVFGEATVFVALAGFFIMLWAAVS